jgi:hypothetical protein
MPVAVNPAKPEDYVFEEDKEKEDAPTFRLVPLRSTDLSKVLSVAEYDKDGELKLTSDLSVEATKYGLSGWKKFFFDDGKPVPFYPGKRKMNVDRLILKDVVELGTRVLELSELIEKTKKN